MNLNCWSVADHIRALQHSMVNFLRAFPQLRCTELQLNTRLASLQLKRVAHEQSEGVWPFEVAGWPTECTISSDNLNCGHAQKKIYHWVLYGILRSTIRPAKFAQSLSHTRERREGCAERGERGAPREEREAREVRRERQERQERRERCAERGKRGAPAKFVFLEHSLHPLSLSWLKL